MNRLLKKFIAKISRTYSEAQHKRISADKEMKERKEKILMMAMLSGSIRRIK